MSENRRNQDERERDDMMGGAETPEKEKAQGDTGNSSEEPAEGEDADLMGKYES